MQLMCNKTEEGNTQDWNFDVDVLKFSNKSKSSTNGWNTIYNLKSDLFKDILKNEYMYLVQFLCPDCAESIATTNYELEYASVKKNNFTEPISPRKSGERKFGNFLQL
jgi:glutamine amidotransferase